MQNYTPTIEELKIGIALCGGGARGIAHAGVLKALEKNGIFPQIIAGSSMGAIVGAFYAEGITPDEIVQILSKPRFYTAYSIRIPHDGLTDLSYLKGMLKKNIQEDAFESLKKELFVCVSNLNTGQFEMLNSGKLSTAVLASSSIPLIFKPVKIGNYLYVDGGMLNNLPVEPLEHKCDIIIGVNVNGYGLEDKIEGMFAIGERCANLIIRQNSKQNAEKCHCLIEVEEAYPFGIFDFKYADKIFQAGFDKTQTLIPSIQNLIRSKKKRNKFFKFWN